MTVEQNAARVSRRLSSGQYNEIITDKNNCQTRDSSVLSEPEKINLAFDVTNAYCTDKPDGEIILTPTGGVPGTDYIYLWFDNSTGRNISNIPAGNYHVTVTDANAC